jgi:hypothetical protein
MTEIIYLPGENPQDYAKLKADLFAQFKPCGCSEEKLVTSVSKALWKLKRVQRLSLDRVLANDAPEPAAAGTN